MSISETAKGAVIVPGGGHIRGFDGVRAIAVAFVIIIHLGAYIGDRARFRPLGDGVMIFFVLSGFLITGLLLNDSARRLGRFYARRALRLYPALLLYLCAVALFGVLGYTSVPSAALVAGALYVSNYMPHTSIARETSHLWSLGVEEQFYRVWPLVIFYVRRWALAVAVAAIAASWLWRLYPPHDPSRYVDRYFLPAADSILFGCIAALVVCGNSMLAARTLRWCSSPTVLVAALCCYVSPALQHANAAGEVNNASPLAYVQRLGVVLVLLWICCNQTSPVVRALEFRPVRYLGRISSGIYLWQGLFVRNGPGDPAGWFDRPPFNVILAIACAAVSFELVERRFLALKDRRFS